MRNSNIRIYSLCLVISLINLDCSDQKKAPTEKSSEKLVTPITTEASPSKDTLSAQYLSDSLKHERNKLTAELIKGIKTIKVLEITKENRRFTSNREDWGSRCDKWNLDKITIERIIKASKTISGEEHHLLYDVMPCEFIGTAVINKQSFSFSVNAGSYLYISNADTTFLLGCTNKKFEKYFLRNVWDGKSE